MAMDSGHDGSNGALGEIGSMQAPGGDGEAVRGIDEPDRGGGFAVPLVEGSFDQPIDAGLAKRVEREDALLAAVFGEQLRGDLHAWSSDEEVD